MTSLNKIIKKFCILLFFVIFLIINVHAAELKDNNKLYYTFDNTLKNSIIDYNLNNSGATYTSSGKINGAYSYDGVDNYMDTNYNSSILNNDFTFSLWFKTSDEVGGLFSKNDLESDPEIRVQTNGDNIRATFEGSTLVLETSGTDFTDNAWHFLVLTKSGSNLNLDIDDNSEDSGIYSGTYSDDANLVLGTDRDDGGNIPIVGIIDEFSFWERVLNTSEKTYLYALNTPTNLQQYPYNSIASNSIITDLQEFYNTSNINIAITTLHDSKVSYSLNSNSNITINKTIYPLIRNLSLNLTDGIYNISFYAEYNSTITKKTNLNFTIDTISPTINIFNESESNFYFVDFTKKFNVSDVCLCSCKVITENTTTNCFNYTYNKIGDYLVKIVVNDTAGNIGTKNYTQRINPYYNITFLDFLNNTPLSNFSVNVYNSNGFQESINDTNGTIKIYPYQKNGTLVLGNYTITFLKNSFLEYNFTKNLNLTNAETTTQFNVNPAYIKFNIKNIDTNTLVNNGNYTVVINNQNTQESEIYDIINNNTITIRNNYKEKTDVQLNLLTNESVLANYQLITPRQNITVNFYVTEKITISQPFEVVDGAFLPIKNYIVSLYVYIDGEGFILQSEKTTNDVGVVNFNMIPFETLYTVCNIYQGETVCLNQITIDTSQNTLRLIHSQTLEENTEELLEYITWSYSENKTETTREISFTFDDSQKVVSSFCVNVSRFNGTKKNYVGSYCQESPNGIIVQTFSLSEGEYLEYTFLYNYNNIPSLIKTIRSYYSETNLEQIKLNSIFDLLFLIIYFGAIGLFLGFKNFEVYNIGVLTILLIIYIIQSVINESYINITLWGFITLKTIFLYFVRSD